MDEFVSASWMFRIQGYFAKVKLDLFNLSLRVTANDG
jgi:hypothetical protein